MKGYKALGKGLTAYNGFQYEIGKEYEINGELKICKNGFHFCQNIIDVFGYWEFDKESTVVCEVEAIGKIVQEGTKFCSEKIKLTRVLNWKEIENVINADNSGNYNSGNRNSGDYNSGNRNSGNYNSGSFNSGNYNSGSFNSGNCNSGDRNNGNCNSGYRNSGNHNSGHHNIGDHNSGCYNSGDYNSGYYNSGFFNTNEPTVRLFNTDSGLTFKEFCKLGIDFRNFENSKEIITSLPNYDAQIFYECTGIDWRGEK